MKVKQLNELATAMVGDGGKTNVFFVSLESNVELVTTHFDTAYDFWKSLAAKYDYRQIESTLEDRKWGVICSREKDEEGRWGVIDDSNQFRNRFKPEA